VPANILGSGVTLHVLNNLNQTAQRVTISVK
jgi:hypothetical protein